MDEKELQKNLEEIFRRASEEATERAEEYFSKFKERDKKMLAKVKSGEMTKREYDLWKRNQILAGEKWNSLVDELSNQLAKADETAREEINGSLPSFLAEGMNQALYEAETLGGLSGSFGLVDKNTAVYLAKNNPELLPSLKPESDTAKQIREGKLKRWNQQHITAEVTQGVILGESMDKVAKRLKNVAEMDKKAAMRNARTATGAAVNAGKIEGMKRNEERGVPTEKMWSAILDTRTRHEHRDLDGQIKKLDEPFESREGYKLMYPRDPNGDACMIYNCRCKVVSVPTKIKDMILDMYDREGQVINTYDAEGNIVKAQSYEEWKEDKKRAPQKKTKKKTQKATKEPEKEVEIEYSVIEPKQAPKGAPPFENEKLKKALGKEYEGFSELVKDNPMRYLYDKHLDEINIVMTKDKGGYLEHFKKAEISMDYGLPGMNKYRTVSHELGHSFDHNMTDKGASYKEIKALNNIFPENWPKFKERPSCSDEFLKAVREDISLYKDKGTIESLYKDFHKDERSFHGSHAIQDFLDGAYSTRKKYRGYGHGDKYYNRNYNDRIAGSAQREMDFTKFLKSFDINKSGKQAMRIYDTSSELWAHISSAVVVGGDELEYIKKYTPSAYKKFLEIIDRNKP